MRTITANILAPIQLDKVGTNDTTQVIFNVKSWRSSYPNGLITLIH